MVRGEHYGRRCDVWSIGCVVIQMATGSPPWGAKEATNSYALIYKVSTQPTRILWLSFTIALLCINIPSLEVTIYFTKISSIHYISHPSLLQIASTKEPPYVPEFSNPALRDVTLRCLEVTPRERPHIADLLRHSLWQI